MNEFVGKYQSGDLVDARYEVVRLLGHGGMAEVYLVQDREMHGRRLALKLLFPSVSLDPVNVERFIREVELTQNLNSPHIVKSFHYKRSEKGEQYFTMEYVDGVSLAQVLRERKLNPREVYQYLIQVLSALVAAHAAGVIHRDIKPDNLILTAEKQLKVSDFGIAKDLNSDLALTDPEKGPKSYLYKAPELYVERYDHRVDLYALGITAYELLTGSVPFLGDRNQLVMQHLRAEVPALPRAIPAFFQTFIEQCTAKKPEDRFQSAAEAQNFLRAYAADVAEDDGSDGGKSGWKGALTWRRLRRLLRNWGKKYLFALALSALTLFLSFPFRSLGGALIGDTIDLRLFDAAMKFRPALAAPKDVLIVSVDDASYEHFGLSTLEPWPRELFAQFLEKLSAAKPRLVIFDYRFPKITDPRRMDIPRDERLSKAMSAVPTVISKFLDPMKNQSSSRELVFEESDELFRRAVRGEYFANLTETSGKVRNFTFAPGQGERRTPLADLLKENEGFISPSPADMVNYYGGPGTVEHVSFHQVLSDDFPLERFQNKVVFVGLQLFVGFQVSQRDTFLTPVSDQPLAGVEIHATMAANILEQKWVNRLLPYTEVTILVLATFVVGYLLGSLRPVAGLLLVLILLFGWIPTSYALLLHEAFFPGLLVGVVALVIGYPLAILKVYFERKAAERALGI